MSEVKAAAIPELAAPVETPSDGRRFARRPCKLQAHLTICDALDPAFDTVREFDVVVRNISRNGLCFLFYMQLLPDDRLTLDFGDLVRHYRVARCRRMAANCYEVGVAVVAAP